MYKIMNNPYIRHPFFAADDGGAGGAGGDGGQEEKAGGDDPDGEDPDEDGEEDEKKYTQAEVDATVEKRLAREKRKWQRAQNQKKENSKEETGKEDEERNTELTEERSKNEQLTMKLACYEAGVLKESVKDVAALARSYMAEDEELDLEDAIEEVLKKYPQFKGDTQEPEKKGTWGQRQTGKPGKEKSLEDEISEAIYGK